MKANELMIGDWVKTPMSGASKAGDIFNTGIVTEDGESVLNDEIEPIPITPEILERNGFEIRGKRKYFLVPNDPSLAIKREPGIGANGNSFLIGHFWERNKNFRWFVEINYVHELQHALRLCGIEKEIEL